MTVRFLTIAWTLSMALLAAGCAPDCVSACESENGCQGAVKRDCAKDCSNAEALNDLADRGDQYDDLLVCIEDQEDVCVSGAQCQTKAEQYADCIAGYCINKQADRGGNPLPDDQTDANCRAAGL